MSGPRYVEAPTQHLGDEVTVFLAGGITGCPDWQSHAAQRLLTHATVLNPRRKHYAPSPAEHATQVGWEYAHLRAATVIMFWFPAKEIQPVALLELGAYAYASLGSKPLIVGADPNYPRRADLILQMSCARPDLTVHESLDDTINHTMVLLETL